MRWPARDGLLVNLGSSKFAVQCVRSNSLLRAPGGAIVEYRVPSRGLWGVSQQRRKSRHELTESEGASQASQAMRRGFGGSSNRFEKPGT